MARKKTEPEEKKPHRSAANGVIKPFKFNKTWKKKDGTTVTEVRWMVKYDIGTTPDGKRRQIKIERRTYTACQEAFTKKLKELHENGGITYDTKTTVFDYGQHWLEQKRHEVDPKTYMNYRMLVNRHLGALARKPVSKIIPSMVQSTLNNAKSNNGEPAGLSLKRQLRTCLNQMFAAAVADRIIPINPVTTIKTPKRKDIGPTRTAFSVPELKAMLEAASNPNITPPETGARMWFRLLTGMRQGEILGATWDSYNAKQHLYVVNWKLEQLLRTHGCGTKTKDGWPCKKQRGAYCTKPVWLIPDGYDKQQIHERWFLTRPKSQTGRLVPIVPELSEVLKRHKALTKKWENPGHLMFCHKDGTVIEPKEDTTDFQNLLRAAEITGTTHTGHETRHSVVSLLASQGVDFQLIKEIVGHSSDAMVEHYRHADNTERLKAMETLNSSLNLAQIEWKK